MAIETRTENGRTKYIGRLSCDEGSRPTSEFREEMEARLAATYAGKLAELAENVALIRFIFDNRDEMDEGSEAEKALNRLLLQAENLAWDLRNDEPEFSLFGDLVVEEDHFEIAVRVPGSGEILRVADWKRSASLLFERERTAGKRAREEHDPSPKLRDLCNGWLKQLAAEVGGAGELSLLHELPLLHARVDLLMDVEKTPAWAVCAAAIKEGRPLHDAEVAALRAALVQSCSERAAERQRVADLMLAAAAQLSPTVSAKVDKPAAEAARTLRRSVAKPNRKAARRRPAADGDAGAKATGT